jgi:phage-related minor tail protein
MKREELTAAGLSDEQVEKVMKLNGDDINREKSKYSDYDDVKKQLEKANATIDGMKDYEDVKAKVTQYQQEAENAKKEAAAKVQQLELQAKIKDFTGNKKFVNDLTRDAINAQLEAALEKTESKGKSLEDLFKEFTDGKENIVIDEKKPTPPVVTGMQGNKGDENGVMAAFKRMNPDLKID